MEGPQPPGTGVRGRRPSAGLGRQALSGWVASGTEPQGLARYHSPCSLVSLLCLAFPAASLLWSRYHSNPYREFYSSLPVRICHVPSVEGHQVKIPRVAVLTSGVCSCCFLCPKCCSSRCDLFHSLTSSQSCSNVTSLLTTCRPSWKLIPSPVPSLLLWLFSMALILIWHSLYFIVCLSSLALYKNPRGLKFQLFCTLTWAFFTHNGTWCK